MTQVTDAALDDYERRNKHWLDTLRQYGQDLELPTDLPEDLRQMLEMLPKQA